MKEKYKIFKWLYRYIFSAFMHPKNFFFCLKYPFMRQANVWTGKFMGYDFTWYDDILPGWQKAFGKQFLEDLKRAIKEDEYDFKQKQKSSKNKSPKEIRKAIKEHKSGFSWQQIKEKYGTLRLYCSCGSKARKVCEKYEWLSMGYCCECGRPARYCSKGWVEFYCELCFIGASKTEPEDKEAEYIKSCRLTKKDIPELTRCYPGKPEYKVDIKEEYGIDFEELWGLKK